MATGEQTLVIWRIRDGRAGHDNQSSGLINALGRITQCNCHDLDAGSFAPQLSNYLRRRCPPGERLESPDLIVGAGRRTHLPLLIAGHARGGRTIVIMRPGLPLSLFDYCLIPRHDNPPVRRNVVPTEGALNNIRPSDNHRDDTGLIMIGGASRHFYWHDEEVLHQVRLLLAATPGVKWSLTDSPRTPGKTRDLLAGLDNDNAAYTPFRHTGQGWIEERLERAGQAWITQDSLSMIYESITAGAATGLFTLPAKKHGKHGRAIAGLQERYGVVLFDEWQAGKVPRKPDIILDEAERCAKYLLDKVG